MRSSGAGILNRRSSASRIKLVIPTSGRQESGDNHDEPTDGLWVYPEVLDVIAVVASLCLAVGSGALFAYSYEDLNKADDRYLEYKEDGYWAKQDASHPVSTGLNLFAGMSLSISCFALVSAVVVRTILTYATNMKKGVKRKFLLSWANPLSILVALFFALGVMLTAPTLNFIGWIVFPPELTDGGVLGVLGACFIVATGLLFIIAIYLALRTRNMGRSEASNQETTESTTAACNSGNPSEATKDDNPLHDLWMYPEILDVIALAGAICLGVSSGALFAFSYETVRAADARYLKYHPDGYWAKQDELYPVSTGLMLFTGMSISISTFAVVSAVVVRIMLTYATNMTEAQRKFLLSWANPLSILVVLCFALGLLLSTPTMTFVAWIVFPPKIALSSVFLSLGVAFMIGTFILFLISIYLAVRAWHIGKREAATRATRSSSAWNTNGFDLMGAPEGLSNLPTGSVPENSICLGEAAPRRLSEMSV